LTHCYQQTDRITFLSRNPITTFTSTASGVYFIDKLPYGIYYLHETDPNAGWFTLTVGDDTVTGSRDGVVISAWRETREEPTT
jgi:hypothetical protein